MKSAIVWMEQDLRLADNAALNWALETHERVYPVYLSNADCGSWSAGAAQRWWLHHSLTALDRRLRAKGSRLLIRHGEPQTTLASMAHELGADTVAWNRHYEPHRRQRDATVYQALLDAGCSVQTFQGNLLFEPWSIENQAGEPYKVFSSYWRRCLRTGFALDVLPEPDALPPVARQYASEGIDSLGLLPKIDWDRQFYEHWQPGEDGAQSRAERFADQGLNGYRALRDRPDHPGTSEISAHLHFGEISPRQLALRIQQSMDASAGGVDLQDAEVFLRELGWREFAHHLLHHFPHTPERPLNERFADFPWANDFDHTLRCWQRGRTGIPMVDAGMRQLWSIGWMHNRVRMIVASFLTKNLLIPWQEGEHWFWDTLVDADLASNTLGWQWTAGCGADAAPYFRVFNPVTQGQKFDPQGTYVRRWIPELAGLPDTHIHRPWDADADMLEGAGVTLGEDYPEPLVDLKASRVRALEAYEQVKG